MKLQKIGIVLVVISIVVLILLIFLKIQTDNQILTACELSCNELGNHLDFCPHNQNNNLSWTLILMSFFVAFIGGTGVYLSLPKKTVRVIEEKEYDISSLSDEEKKVFLFIKAHKGGVYQSHIVKEFNLSKVQTTCLLDKLEGSGLVERKRRGMTNIVILK